MSTPKRVQMTRNKPWRGDNPDAVIVDRRTKWGNPFTIEGCIEAGFADGRDDARPICVGAFRDWLNGNSWATGHYWDAHLAAIRADLHELRGKDLACWCPLDASCHADVLLELANKDGDT